MMASDFPLSPECIDLSTILSSSNPIRENELQSLNTAISENLDKTLPDRFDFCDLCLGLTEQIPSKSFNLDKGLMNEKVISTCFDADDSQIAVGTSVGNIYIFNRRLRKMFTIKGKDHIVCLKLSHNGEYSLLSIGLKSGLFVAIQLPSSDEGKSRKLLQKVIADVHRCEITCIIWSMDGRKLFTGDSSGLIMMTLVDFENNVFETSFVYCDSDHYPITQLAFWGNYLAASTTNQAFLVDIADDCRVQLVGHQSKKGSVFKCGVTFAHGHQHDPISRPFLYVSRPGCRLWQVDLTTSNQSRSEGPIEVVETQDYQHAASSTASLPVPLELQHPNAATFTSHSTVGFGLLYYLATCNEESTTHSADLLVTHDEFHLFIIDFNRRILSVWAQFGLPIANVTVCSKTREILILFSDPESTPSILRISSVFADPWLVTSPSNGKPAKKSAEDAMELAASGVKDLLQKVISNSTQLVNKSVDALTVKDSGPNFQIVLNKIRASTIESNDTGAGTTMDEFDDMANLMGTFASRPSTPDTQSLASGCGTALPPWCLEDQSLQENASTTALAHHVQITRGKPRSRSKSTVKINNIQKPAHKTSKSSSSDENSTSTSLAPISSNDHLATPTEEKYLQNRFNPFDQATDTATREQLEEMLDSTLFHSTTASDNLNSFEPEAVVECVVKDICDSNDSVTSDYSEMKNRLSFSSLGSIDATKQSPSIAKSFRELLLNEARIVGVDEADFFRPAQRRRSTAELLASIDSVQSPDDGSCDISVLGKTAASGRDIWCQVTHEKPIVYITGCAHYFAFVDVDQSCQYFSYVKNNVVDGDLLSIHDKEEGWSTMPEKVDSLAVSPNGRIVWRVLDEIAYGQLRPNVHTPLGRKWCEAGRDVSTKIAVCNSSAWYLKTDGTVCAQTQLRPDRPCFKIAHIDCEWPLVQLACSDDVVWGLRQDGRLIVRIGIKSSDFPTGIDWIDFVPDGPTEIVALDLFQETAWAIDTMGRLWFCGGVNNKHPIGTTGRWWQVALPGPLSSDGSNSKRRTLPHAVCVTPVGVHLAVDRSIWYCRGGVTGHRWSRIVPMEWESVAQFRRIWASCLFDEMTDYIWLIRLNYEFMAFQPHSRRLESLVAPCSDAEVVAICGALGYVWTLDSSGRIFVRIGIDPVHNPLGSRWDMLDMSQFEGGKDQPVKLIHLSCNLDAVWTCDEAGNVYARQGVASFDSTGLPSAWVRLDDVQDVKDSRKRRGIGKLKPLTVRKLFCSPDGTAVWALTKAGRIYVRLGITRDVPIGEKWTEIEDIKARTLAVGCNCAWAVNEDFELFQRYGITHDNPAGNFWKPLGYKLRTVAATPDGKLWGLDLDQRLVRHRTKLYNTSHFRDDNGSGKSSDEAGIPVGKRQTRESECNSDIGDYEVV